MEHRNPYPLALYLAKVVREREIRAAARRRLVPRQPRHSIRRAIGQSIIRIGARVADEPVLELARSR